MCFSNLVAHSVNATRAWVLKDAISKTTVFGLILSSRWKKPWKMSIWEHHPATFLLTCVPREWRLGETNTWTTATILAWYPQKVVVEHRLPPVLTWGWGNPWQITSAKIASKSSARKCSENFVNIFGDLAPIFTQPKRRNFSHEIPLSFPHGFPRRFRAWESSNKRFPQTKAYSNQYSPNKKEVIQSLYGGWAPALASLGQWQWGPPLSALFDSKSRWKPVSCIKSFFIPDLFLMFNVLWLLTKKHEHPQGFCTVFPHCGWWFTAGQPENTKFTFQNLQNFSHDKFAGGLVVSRWLDCPLSCLLSIVVPELLSLTGCLWDCLLSNCCPLSCCRWLAVSELCLLSMAWVATHLFYKGTKRMF